MGSHVCTRALRGQHPSTPFTAYTDDNTKLIIYNLLFTSAVNLAKHSVARSVIVNKLYRTLER